MTTWELLGHRWFWVLVHSLWQQSLVAIGLWIILRYFVVRSADRRYALALGIFALATLLPVVTWAWMSPASDESARSPERPLAARPVPAPQSDGEVGEAPHAVAERDFSPGIAREAATAPGGPLSLPSGSRAWIVLLLCWTAGTTLHLVRAVRDLSATTALLRGQSLHDSELLNHVARARDLLHLRRRFDVLISPADVGPFVFGLWKPTLVLPAALLGGFPPDQVEAILLHELAHLRRYDDVVNLLQRLVEAVFFFNPALLWMSRVLRREREAACDARAVACLGSPFSLAEALFRVAEGLGNRTQSAVAALSFADSEDSGALLDRVRRIVRPNDRPRLRLAWPALVGALLFVGLSCLGLEQAAFWSIALAKDWLSPEQRIAAVEEVLQKSNAAPVDLGVPGRKFQLKGKVRTIDGAPLPDRRSQLYSVSRRTSGGGSSTSSATLQYEGGQFDVSVEPGECWLLLYPTEGYAPAVAGPFRGAGGDMKDGIEIVLQAGSPGAVRVVDGKGKPIAGATVTAHPDWGIGSIVGPSLPEKTDQDGLWKTEHASDSGYRLTIRAPGFSTFNSTIPRKISGEPQTITLDPSDPIAGIVVDPQGNPVRGAKVSILAEKRPAMHYSFGGTGKLAAETGDDGTFRLDEVSLDSTYDLLFDAGEAGHALRSGLPVDGKQLRIELQKKLTLAGQFRGDPDELAAVRKLYFGATSYPEGSKEGRNSSTKIDEEGRFRFDSLFAGKYHLSVGRHMIDGRLEESKLDLIVELNKSEGAGRDVEVRFVEGGMPVRPAGTVGVQMEILDDAGQPVWGGPRAIVDGIVRLRVRPSDTLRLIPEGCLGYWFHEVNLPVPDGAEPFIAEVPVLPAGAVRVKILSPVKRGKSKPQVGAGIQFSLTTQNGTRMVSIHRNSETSDEVVLSPIPIDVPYLVSASQDYRRAFAPVSRLEGDAPVRDVTLALPSAIDAAVHVETASGAALSRISLEVNHSPPSSGRGGNLTPGGMSWMNDQLVTDREGRVTLVGLPANEEGYSITAKPMRDWQPGKATIRTDGGVTILTLQPGNILEGKVVDKKTGRGVPDISLSATLVHSSPGKPADFNAEAPTDAEGNFRFSNLPDEKVRLLPTPASFATAPEVIPGTKEPVVVEIQVP